MSISTRRAGTCRRFFSVALASVVARSAAATTLRIAEYNIDCSDQDNNNAVTGANAGIPAVIQAMGLHHLGANAQPVDVMALTELLDTNNNSITSTTLPALVNSLNALYGAGVYAYDTTPDPTSGGTQYNGPSGLIYDTKTVQVISAKSLLYSGNSGNSNPRAPMRYELQPIGYGSNADFYVYVSHMKSGTTSADQSERGQEATIIRNDEATLPSTASVIYTGDLNSAPPEAEFTDFTAAGQGQAFDPEGFTTSKTYFSEATYDLQYRDDYELMTSNVLNDSGPLDYITGSLQIFGNNGTTSAFGRTNSSGNTSLSDLSNATTILNDLMQPYGSDHMPVVADYNIGVNPLPVVWQGGTDFWSNSAKWSTGSIPNSATVEVQIDNANPTPSVVTLNQNATVQDLTLDANDSLVINSGQTLAINGPNPTTLNGAVTNSGIVTLTGGSITNTGTFTQSTGSLNMAGNFTNSGTAIIGGTQSWSAGTTFSNTAGTASFNTDAGSASSSTLAINVTGGTVSFASTQHLASLSIAVGATATVIASSPHSVIVTGSLSNAGLFDLTNNCLIVQGTSPAIAATNLNAVQNALKIGFNAQSGYWNGAAGITSSQAAGDTTFLTTLGYGPSAGGLFDGVNTTSNDVLVKYTYYGDANLDGAVDGADYQQIDNGFGLGLTGWSNGDFNYDGVVDGSDYSLIDNVFNQLTATGSAPLTMIASPTDLVASQVPEPTTLALLGLGSISQLRLGRRRKARTQGAQP